MPNPATFFDDSDRDAAARATTSARPGTLMERFSFGGPNDSFNKRRQRTWTIGDTLTWTAAAHALRIGGEFRRNEFDTNLPEEQATEFEKFDNFTQILRGLATRGRHAVRHHRQAVPVQRLQPVPRRRLAGVADADAEPRGALRVLRLARRSWTAGSATSISRRSPTPRTRSNAFIVPEQRAEHRLRGDRRGHRARQSRRTTTTR